LGPVVLKYLPKEAKQELDKHGIDLGQIIEDIEKVIEECSEEEKDCIYDCYISKRT